MKELRQIVINSLISIEGFLIGVGITSVFLESDYVKWYYICLWGLSYLICSLLILGACWVIDKVRGSESAKMQIGSHNTIENTSIEQDENGLHITVPKGTKVEVREI